MNEASHRISSLTQQHMDDIGKTAPRLGGVDVKVVRALLWPPSFALQNRGQERRLAGSL